MPIKMYTSIRLSSSIFLIIASCLASLIANAQAQVEYKVDVVDPVHHLAQVSIKLPEGQTFFLLKLPNWRTGNYRIINQANGIREFSAMDHNGDQLEWQRMDKSSWSINNPSKKAATASYMIYANELGSRTRHIDASHAYLDATSVLMYEQSMMKIPHIVELAVPNQWRSFSGMKQLGKHRFKAKDYDQLADSPIETGINKLVEFSKDRRDYQVVFWGQANRSHVKIAADIEKMVESSQTIWSGYPFNKYLFIIHATSGVGGATEHVNSTVIQRSRDLFGKQEDYLNKFLRTAAHEFVHTWNVKAYRPQGLVPYDYQAENYTDLLWMAEGSTSYLQDRLLLVSELESVKEYLEYLSKAIDQFQHKPGAQVQSVSESSNEAWIARRGDFANNYSVNIYSEGFMATWLLDFKMLKTSKLKVSVRDLHQALFKQKQDENLVVKAYDSELVKELLRTLTGENYEKWWHTNIDRPLAPDFEKLISQAGLRFKKVEQKDLKVWTGFSSKNKKGQITLDKVERNSPAWNAGLTTNDQILAINGYKVTQDNLEKWLTQFKKDDLIELSYFREQKLMSSELKLSQTTKKPKVIELNPAATRQQKAFFKAWLGVDFPDKDKKP